MNLQAQKRGLSQNKINNYHYLNGKKNATNVLSNTTGTNNNFILVNNVMNQDDNRFKPLISNASKSIGSSPSISAKMKYHTEDDENNKSSLGLFQQISNINISHMKQNEGLNENGVVNLGSGNTLVNNTSVSNDFKEKSQLSGLSNCNSGMPSNNNTDSKKKRSRVIYCHVCCQYKPRSTRARFQVCQHIACYDCVRLALMIQQRYNVKAHCPFCQIELDWNKVKPFIVLFKPKSEVNAVDDNNKTLDSKQESNLGGFNNNSLGLVTTSNGTNNAVTSSKQNESTNYNINSQIVSNDLIAQAFECNGVSKEKILKGFFSCYLQKQTYVRNNGCILQNNNNNSGCVSQNTLYDSKELQNTYTSYFNTLDPYKAAGSICYGGVSNKQYIPLKNFVDQNDLVLPNIPNSLESSCGEFLPDVGLAPIGEALPLVNCMQTSLTAKEFNPYMYGGNFNSTISNNGAGNNTIGHNINMSIFLSDNNHMNNNSSNCNINLNNSNSSISSISSSSNSNSGSSSSSIGSIVSNISYSSSTTTATRNSNGVSNNSLGPARVFHGSNCNCTGCLKRGGRPGMVSSMGLGIISPGSILSTIYDENNPRGFACGLFNPSIPTDGVVLMHHGKSNKGQYIHFELQKQFMVDSLDNYSINFNNGGNSSNISAGMNANNNTANNHYIQQNNHRATQSQNQYQLPYLLATYGNNCNVSSIGNGTFNGMGVGNTLLNYEDAISHSLKTSNGVCNTENVRLSTGISEIFGFFEASEDKQMPSWMITTPCLNMKDILSDWRNSTLLKSHSDMVICSI
ncbi:RING finger containing [Cryptosporidium sp. chipmunk genotype I]|uniref:RING finger containing n=1 Tax=Cryptosporidium sp. chipmunk genotype I TaxID=1280935 RepID=UPI00351AA328|nr:RING finger containing [Cryptosporidium sp. chipmunk genotype I]